MTLTLDHPQSLQLRRLLEAGLPLVSRPYAWLAEQIGASEQAVLEQVRQWNEGGLFRRVGLVLKHRALGFRANAMLVLDVPDAQIDAIGHRLGSAPGVNMLPAPAAAAAMALQPVLHGPWPRARAGRTADRGPARRAGVE